MQQKNNEFQGPAIVIPITKELAEKNPFIYVEETEFGHYAMLLYLIIKSQRLETVVEMGIGEGYSTRFLLEAIKDFNGKVYSIDIEDKTNIKISKDNEKNWKFIQGNSAIIGVGWKEPIDLIFIDGDHSYLSVLSDLAAWYQHVKKDGYIAMHDCTSNSEVEQAMNQFFKDKQVEKIVFPQRHLSLAIIKKLED